MRTVKRPAVGIRVLATLARRFLIHSIQWDNSPVFSQVTIFSLPLGWEIVTVIFLIALQVLLKDATQQIYFIRSAYSVA